MSNKRAVLTDEEVERIIDLTESGKSPRAVARLVGCSQGSVSWALLREGVDLHADRALPPVPTSPIVQRRGDHVVRRFTQEEDAQLAALEAQGLKTYQIARRLGRQNNSVVGRMRTLARRAARAEVQDIDATPPLLLREAR